MIYPYWLASLLEDPWVASVQLVALSVLLVLVARAYGAALLQTRRDVLVTVGLLVLATALRLYFWDATIYEHSHYAREERLPRLLALFAHTVNIVVPSVAVNPYRVMHGFNLVAAVLTVPAIALHTELIFHRRALSWTAALLLACHPMHVKMSSSEAPVISSLLLAAVTFIAFHLAFHAEDQRRRLSLGLLLLATFPIFLLTRPLNFLAFPVLFVFAALYRARFPGRRDLVVLTALLFLEFAGFVLALDSRADMFAPTHSQQIIRSLPIWLLSGRNVLFNPGFVSVAGLALLVLGGLRLLWTRPFAFLAIAAWYLGTLAITSVAVAESPFGNTKYYLQLVYPLLIVSAHAVDLLPKRLGKAGRAALVAVVVAMPFTVPAYMAHADDYQLEHAFLKQVLATLQPGDQVLEIPVARALQGERLRLYDRNLHTSFRLFSQSPFQPPDRPRPLAPTFVNQAAKLDPTRPAYFLCGLECATLVAAPLEPEAALHDEIRRDFVLTPVLVQHVPAGRRYLLRTSGLTADMGQAPPEVALDLTLFRITPKRPAATP